MRYSKSIGKKIHFGVMIISFAVLKKQSKNILRNKNDSYSIQELGSANTACNELNASENAALA